MWPFLAERTTYETPGEGDRGAADRLTPSRAPDYVANPQGAGHGVPVVVAECSYDPRPRGGCASGLEPLPVAYDSSEAPAACEYPHWQRHGKDTALARAALGRVLRPQAVDDARGKHSPHLQRQASSRCPIEPGRDARVAVGRSRRTVAVQSEGHVSRPAGVAPRLGHDVVSTGDAIANRVEPPPDTRVARPVAQRLGKAAVRKHLGRPPDHVQEDERTALAVRARPLGPECERRHP